ncbi:MAG: hypothetical protein QXO32_01530 [Candidatus Bathyarchaeia archaeon]
MGMRWGGWGGGFRAAMGFSRGPWPGAGPFSYLPPWQRPGWLFGRWAFMGMFNPYAAYGGLPTPMGYGPSQYMGFGPTPPYTFMPSFKPPGVQQAAMPPYGLPFGPYSISSYAAGRRWW